MATMLENYRHRFGSAVKAQGNGFNGPCPLCGGEPGKSDRFIIWPDREHDLGHTCAVNHIPGVCYCRQCRFTGDSIKYLMEIEGLSFREACAELGISNAPVRLRHRPAPREPRAESCTFTPQAWELPTEKWVAYATKLQAEAEQEIWNHPEALKWLAARGITEEAVRTYRLGYLVGENGKAGRYRSRSALGLAPKEQDGKAMTMLFIPRGITIPLFAEDGRLINLRIRKPNADLAKEEGRKCLKYIELEGSCRRPLLLRPEAERARLSVYVIVEGELDAVLCHYATGGGIGALAVRSNTRKPDAEAHSLLEGAVRLLVALDYEDSLNGVAGLKWWMDTYPHARRWPTPEGKDPGEAYGLGVDIREWISEGLPRSVSLPDAPGSVEAFSCGRVFEGGGGETPTNSPSLEKGKGQDGCAGSVKEALPAGLREAMPAYLAVNDVPPDVLHAWALWQGLPVRFIKEDGGFRWLYSHSWVKRHRDQFEAFWRFQDGSDALWDWLSAHVAAEIGAHNLLKIWG